MNNFQPTISILILLALAILTFFIITLIGSVLRRLGPEKTDYSFFEFQKDRQQTVSTNVLINIFIPNVLMVLIFGIAEKSDNTAIENWILLYPAFYYLVRIFNITVVKNRRELLGVYYTIVVSGMGMVLAVLLKKFFLIQGQQIFITIDELREELWFCIIIVIYHFVVLIIQTQFKQRIIVNDEQVHHYIFRMFDKLYERYNYILPKDNQANLHILVYSIMILENYNRGKFVRGLEKVKVTLTGSATLGIMQVRSDKVISDEDSIRMAYEQLQSCLEMYNLPEDVKGIAIKYNPSDEYAEAVDTIFSALKEYIDAKPSLRTDFYGTDSRQLETKGNVEPENGLYQKFDYCVSVYSNENPETQKYSDCLSYINERAVISSTTYGVGYFRIEVYLNDRTIARDILSHAIEQGFLCEFAQTGEAFG